MTRYKLLIEYDGSPFVGWQRQENGLSVQESIEKSISELFQEQVTVFGAGRTDAGVHAMGQVGHFDILEKYLDPQTVTNGLNNYLRQYPVSIIKTEEVDESFHARFSAKKRIYRYIIINRRAPIALKKNRVWHIQKDLNIKLMKKGAKILEGTHDFSTFRSSSCQSRSPIKTLDKVKIKRNKEKIEIIFSSKSFLQQQVRSMVGALKYLGEQKWSVKQFKKNFESKKRSNCAPPAPPYGLYLKKIN